MGGEQGISLLKHYVIASQSQRRLKRKTSSSLSLGIEEYTFSWGPCDVGVRFIDLLFELNSLKES